MKLERIQKMLDLSIKDMDSKDDQNPSFSGKAAGIGNMDRGGDVIAPGASVDAIPGFLAHGSILLGHQWHGLPIAMPTVAKEVGDGLFFGADFHKTKEALDVHQVMKERMDAGKSVGLSIGFSVAASGRAWFDNGEELYKFATDAGIAVDQASCLAWKHGCRLITKIAELYEVSVVVVPMNASALATAVKDILGGDGSHAGLSLADHLDTVLAAVEGATSRIERYAAKRLEEDRTLSEDRTKDIKELVERLTKLQDAASPRPAEKTVDLSEVKDRLMVLRRHAM